MASSESGWVAGSSAHERLWALLDAGLSVSGELDLETVLRRIVEAACEVIGARYGALGVINEDRSGLANFVHTGVGPDVRKKIGHLPFGRGLLGALIEDPTPIRLDDIGSDPRSVGFPDHHPEMRTFLGVPIIVRGRVYGNLYLAEKRSENDGDARFTAEDQSLAMALAAQAGIAIENARLYGRVSNSEVAAKRRLRELEVVQEVGSALLAELDPTRVLRMLAHEAVDLVGGSMSYVAMASDDGKLRVRVAAGPGSAVIEGAEIGTESSLTAYAMRSLQSLLSADAEVDHRGRPEMGDVVSVGSLIVAPLVERRSSVGALGILHEETNHFSDEDLFVARRFADLGSLALRNATYVSSERERARVEVDLAEAQIREQLRGQTIQAVIRAQEDERARIARELHDSAAQSLTSILLSLKIAEGAGDLEDVRAKLAELRDLASSAARDLRRIAMELRPVALDDLGLADGLENLCGGLSERSGIPIEVSVELDGRLEPEVETVLYRIAQEAATNAIRKAAPGRIRVDVRSTTGGTMLEVEDDGRGFDQAARTEGLGLIGMRERAALVGGKFEIESKLGEGTRVRLAVPKGES